MITQEMLAADAALSGLTDEQRNAIVTMSKNDEEVVIGNRFREVYNRLDETIAKETGISRNGDEKTYNYLERAARQLAAKANSVEGLNTKIADLTKEREKLQKALEEGGDEATKKQLSQALKDLDAVRKQNESLKGDYDKMKTEHESQLFNIQVDNILQTAKAGLKFKAEFPQAAIDTLLAQAINTVKSMNPELIDDGKGGKTLAFKDANGQYLQNPETRYDKYTAQEMLIKELRTMGILDEGRREQGTGSKAPQQHQGGDVIVDLTFAKTQREADDIIHNQLMAMGMIRGSKEYQKAYDAAWKDNNVSSLPR